MNATDVNLYLVGFMGTGKSTVGRAVAHKLGFTLVDSDHEIERQQGKTIPEIFANEGEPAFRGMEREFIERGHSAARTVVSCGGGLVVQPGTLALLKGKGVVICLHASIETILERTSRHHRRETTRRIQVRQQRAQVGFVSAIAMQEHDQLLGRARFGRKAGTIEKGGHCSSWAGDRIGGGKYMDSVRLPSSG